MQIPHISLFYKMVGFVILFALGGLEVVWGYCNKYKCSTLLDNCISTSNGVTKLDNNFCTNGEYCIPYWVGYDLYGYCGTYDHTYRYPGAKCTYDSDCFSESCVNNVCKGFESGANCSYSLDCDIGLYCNSNADVSVCSSLKGDGEACDTYWQCDYGYGCNYGICTKYYSILSGSTTEVDCENHSSVFCDSGTCANNDGIDVCIKAFEFDKGGDIVKCNSEQDCTITSGSYTSYTSCDCGLNGDGYSYCESLYGSTYMQDYVIFYRKWMSSSTAKKSHRIEYMGQNLQDYGTYSDLVDFTEYILYDFYVEVYYKADYCVTEIFLGEYRDYYDSQHISDSLLFLEIPAGFFLLVSL